MIGGTGFYSFLDDAREHDVDDAVRRPVGADRRRHRGRAVGGVPAPARPAPRVPAARDQLPRQPLGAALPRRPAGARAVRGRRAAPRRGAGRHRGARPARRPHPPADRVVRRDRRLSTCRSPIPTAPRLGAAVAAVAPGRHRRRHDGGDRGAAVLHPRRVAALRRPGLVPDQHDRQPRGAAGPRAAAVLHRDRAGHRHGRRRWSRGRASTRSRSSRCSAPTSSGSPGC